MTRFFSKRTWLAAGAAVVAGGLLAGQASANTVTVVIKRHAGVGYKASYNLLDSVFTTAIDTPNGITVVSGTGPAANNDDVVQETGLFNGNTASANLWKNYGNSQILMGYDIGVVLFHFDLNALPGFHNGTATIKKAQLRLKLKSGNDGDSGMMAQILTHSWSEGDGNGDYPGSVAGATWENPNGTNTDTHGTKGWGLTGSPNHFDLGVDTDDGNAVTGTNAGTYSASVWNVKDIVQNWADGAANDGLALSSVGNYEYHSSEYTGGDTDISDPALFIQYTYTAVPEPASAWLAMAGFGLLVLVPRYRRRRA